MNEPNDSRESFEVDLSKVNTVIDQDVEFHGDLISKDPNKTVLISGTILGSVRAAGVVVVTEAGEIQGSIRAPRVKLAGRVMRRNDQDGVVVDGALTLTSKARLECNAVYKSLDTERGAVLAGTVGPIDDDFIREQATQGHLPFLKTLKPVLPVGEPAALAPGSGDGDHSDTSSVVRLASVTG